MAIRTRDFLKALWVTSFQPGASAYADHFDSFEKVYQWADLSASGETLMELRYIGDEEPTLTKVAAGIYRLDVPANVRPIGFIWYADPGAPTSPATYESGAVNLLVRDADGRSVYCSLSVSEGATGNSASHLPSLAPQTTEPLAGDVNHRVPNISTISGGFKIIGNFI